MGFLGIYRLDYQSPQLVGSINTDNRAFSYDDSYLAESSSVPLSISLPFRAEPYSEREYRPYFEGLLAEGEAKDALIANLELPDDDYLLLLEACGRECIGDVLVARDEYSDQGRSFYEPVDREELRTLFLSPASVARENAQSRLSLAGTQTKLGLAHAPNTAMGEGWLKPHGLLATTHMLKGSRLRDVPEIEYLCMKAAQACGLECAEVALLDLGNPVLAVKRFDRRVEVVSGEMRVHRLHQEDIAQALGVRPALKYAQLPGGTVHAIADLLRRRSAKPAKDIASFAKSLIFSYLIGNCDAHLKNYSIVPVPSKMRDRMGHIELAPTYDMVCTTYFPRFNREMAVELGGVRAIDNVQPETFIELAAEMGITTAALQGLAKPLAGHCIEGIMRAGNGEFGCVFESTPYIADDLVEDIQPRLDVLRSFCEG